MKKITIIIPLLVCVLLAACNDDKLGPPEKNKYIYDIPQVDLTQDAIVGAYYVNVTSSYWGTKHTATPSKGQYFSTDHATLLQQIEEAEEAGINFFILPFDNSSNDKTLMNNMMQVLPGSNIQFILDYSTSHLKVHDTIPLHRPDKLAEMVNEFENFDYVFTHDNYFKVGDKPVVMITPVNLSSGIPNSANYSLALPTLRESMQALGINLYLIGEINTRWVAPVNYPEHNISPFDAITVKDWSTNDFDRRYGFFSFIDLNWQNWTKFLDKVNADFIPAIFPSYNDKVNSSSSKYYTFGQNGDPSDFINMCNVAKRNMGSKRLIFINSWNDYRKGTNLEPSTAKSGNDGEIQGNEGKFIPVAREQLKKKK